VTDQRSTIHDQRTTSNAQRLRSLIFDFDGVILDSNALKTQAFREIFGRFPAHADAMMAYHEQYVSQSRYAKFGHLAERLGRPDDEAFVNELAREFAALLRDRLDVCPLVPGARALLDQAAAHVQMYLASVTPEPELLRLLEVHDLHRYFKRIFGCPPWTKPAAVGAIVAELGGADGVALIGDSAGDQRAAAAHGVEFSARDSGLAFDPPVRGTADLAVITEKLRTRFGA
jgi:phosphoglycolate phosphatase